MIISELAEEVVARLDDEVPMVDGRVNHIQILTVTLEILEEHGYLKLEAPDA